MSGLRKSDSRYQDRCWPMVACHHALATWASIRKRIETWVAEFVGCWRVGAGGLHGFTRGGCGCGGMLTAPIDAGAWDACVLGKVSRSVTRPGYMLARRHSSNSSSSLSLFQLI